MKKNKNLALTGIICAILFIVYNILVFTIFKTHSSVFWVSYTFMCLAFVVQVVSMLLSFKSPNVETIFFGIPLVSLSIYYLLSELFVSVVFMVFQGAGMTIATVIQVIILAAFSIIAIIALMARDTVQDIGANIQEKVLTLKSMMVDVEILLSQCNEEDLKTSLKKLAETIRYSDPMSNDSVIDVEFRISQKLSELRLCVEENHFNEAKEACVKLDFLFVERNKKLAISK